MYELAGKKCCAWYANLCKLICYMNMHGKPWERAAVALLALERQHCPVREDILIDQHAW